MDGRRLIRSSAVVVVVTVGGYAAVAGVLQLIGPTLVNTAVVLVLLLGVALLMRRPILRSPIARLVGQYGLLPARLTR